MINSKHEDLGGDISGQVIGAAMAVHREFGPGLDEADYERALHLELLAKGIEHQCQVPLPLHYKGAKLDCGYRVDVLLPGQLLIELKAVDKLHPLHEAQLLTYLSLSGLRLGLLMNFNVLMLRQGIIRRANSARAVTAANDRHTASPLNGEFDDLSREVVDAAVEVQRHLGTGLLRSSYEACLAQELGLRGLKVDRGQPANLFYREELIMSSKQIPMLVENRLMVACHCVVELGQLQLARDRSLLRAAHLGAGLCINFHGTSLAGEIRRIRNTAEIGRTQRTSIVKQPP